jgi:hypothetical protein
MRSRPAQRAVAFLVAAITLGIGASSSGATAPPGKNGRIFFSARSLGPGTGCGIASVKVNATGFNCLNPFGLDPAVSPDNTRIASVRGEQPIEVYVTDIKGRGARRLTHAAGAYPNSLSPSFSPDSSRILWFKYGGDPGSSGLWVMNADGSGQRQLTGDGGQDPVFSPSGAQIAYTLQGIAIAGADGAGSHVILGDQNATTINPFARHLEQNYEASWAPDASRLAFSRRVMTTTVDQIESAIDVFAMNPDGSDLRQLTSTPKMDEVDASYSPDGRMIAYYRRPEGDDRQGEIWVMNADGSGQRRVALGANPEWSTLQSGPGRPRLKFLFIGVNRKRRCLGALGGWSAFVRTKARPYTGFHVAFYVDGQLADEEFNTRGFGMGLTYLQAGRRRTHSVRVLVEDAAAADTISRTFTFRRC